MIHVLFMLMEASWLLALLVFVEAALPSSIPILGAILLYPLGYAAARFAPIPQDRPEIEAAWCGGLAFALIFVSAAAAWSAGPGGERPVPSFVFTALVGTLAWIRGWLLARRPPDPKIFALSFQAGLMVVAGVLFLIVDLDVPLSTQFALVGGLVVFGLTGLWQARASTMGWRGGPGNPATALLGLTAVLGIGTLLWVMIDRTALEAMLAAVQGMGRQIGRLILYLLSFLPEMTGSPGEMPQLPPQEPSPRLDMPERAPEPPAPVTAGVLAAILLVLAFGAAAALYQLFKALAGRRRTGRTPGLTYGRASESLLDRLKALLQRLLDRLRRAVAARLERWHLSRVEGSIRGRYTKLLGRLARRGWPRHADETPEEYHRRLAPHWPASAPHFAALTQAFVAARYGGQEADSTTVEELWRRLKPAVGKLRKTHD